MKKLEKKAEKNLYNASSENFIPIACHFDTNTLLTKNGELLQIFQINGINSEKISTKLFNLREMVRQGINTNVHGNNLAFWIHTIRRKANLDDNATYNSMLSGNIHDIWRKKNYWHDKFVNCLYVTVIHKSPTVKLKNFNSFVNSFSPNIIANFQETYLEKACQTLHAVVDKIVLELEEYGAVKLAIRTTDNGCFSDPMFLYRRIMQLNEEECLLPITDISTALSSHQYAVGNDMIEVIDNDDKKFAAFLSIKEYQEVSSEALDKFLQIPVEMVATEVFYFVDKKEVVGNFEEQGYISDISGDSEIKSLNGLDKILGNNENKFCHQQISIMIIGDNTNQLNDQIKKASETLGDIGIVHVREDINLEKTFWAQLPGNFSFLSRMSPTILDNTAALASLHNFPTGNQYNPWGRAITLLRTEKGTPYFMNFHDLQNNTSCCIFGIEKSGRTTLLNFLLSEADKYKPTIIQIVDDLDSSVYIKARGGTWFDADKGLINPLSLEDTEQNREFCFEFFKIISKHHFDNLTEDCLNALKVLSEKVFEISTIDRKLSSIIEGLGNSDTDKILKIRLKDYTKDGLYYELFEPKEDLHLTSGQLIAINLERFDDSQYKLKYFPKEKKLVEEYEYNLNTMRSVKAAIVYSMHRLLCSVDLASKIFAIDNMAAIFNIRCYDYLLKNIAENIKNTNGAFVSTLTVGILEDLYNENVQTEWLNMMGTKFLMPLQIKIPKLDKILNLTTEEVKKIESLNLSSRMFLIKQDGTTIVSELSIAGLPGLTRLLSSGPMEREIWQNIMSQYPTQKLEEWVKILYDELNNIK